MNAGEVFVFSLMIAALAAACIAQWIADQIGGGVRHGRADH